MAVAYFFGVLSLFILVFFLYFLQLLFFYQKEMKRFEASFKEEAYLDYLNSREKKVKSKRKRNFLLYLRRKSYESRGEEKKAENLVPFIKEDRLLDIKEK